MVDDTYSTIGLNNSDQLAREWIVPLSENDKKLREVLSEMEPFKLEGKDVPFIIKFFENPKYNFFNYFPGAVRLKNHDCIHAILGRGVLPKDEAFVIGYTMGSTGKMTDLKEFLFLLIVSWFYPTGYKFFAEEREVFRGARDIAEMSRPCDLSEVDFEELLDLDLKTVRKRLGICETKLRLRYAIEKEMYPESKESQRII
tara:strand:- start:15752 stop:16351 length:600 start_codon:yes stop_codon:yes gene_type:complete